MSDATTTTTAKVSASVMDQYNRVQAGEKPSEVAKALGIKAATVSANVKRVAAHIDAGHTLEVEGDAGSVTLTAAPVIDPHDIAEAMVEGASMITREVAKVEAEGDNLRAKADRLREQADALAAQADALTGDDSPAMRRIGAVATALGFDIAAWREAVAKAEADAKAEGDAPKDEGDDA